ncbi:putative multidrug export ATP-binding/permease protein [Mesoplasma sp. JKS002660]|uniref:ABC transporter ATP-binding protein n=1 Tax=Mesoplasma whartonense TaxID=2878854 RepID=UPI002022B449|nr:ABC transporter ATP-binding protein [Mesoplasma sp. JKS002660]MCL8213636.1 putative multidrug export ATP-binding/permease protein [Mesoplasma sp. JKS002660]
MFKKKQKVQNNHADVNQTSAPRVTFTQSIVHYYKKEHLLASITILTSILGVVAAVLSPLLVNQMTKGIMLDAVPAMRDNITGYWGGEWWLYIIINVALLLINMIAMFTSQYAGFLLSKRIEISLRERALETLVKEDVSYYSDKKIGEILTKIISDTQIVGDQAYQTPTTIIRASLTVLGSFVMMFIFNWKISFIVLAAMILIMVTLLSSFNLIRKRGTAVRATITDINGVVTDRINNVRLIKSSGTEAREIKGFDEIHKRYFSINKPFAKVTAMMVTVLFGGVNALQLITIAASAGFYHSGDAAATFYATTFASISLAEGLLVGAIMQTLMTTVNLANATVATGRIFDTINATSILDPHYDGQGIQIEAVAGDIIFKDVEFEYPEKPGRVILPTFNFTFHEGKSYAIVGETGAGKSTISKLLLRYYDPTKGDVYINGDINLKDVNLSSYLAHVGYVEQEPQILYGDVFENIKYGKFDASEEEVIAAAKKADLHNLVMSWPDKYQTVLGERGMLLSGGQKQRLVIARMFLKDPELLILDEATSSLDNIVEQEIQTELNKLMKDRTTVSIAHRLSTIKGVDQIIVLGANGAGIVQQGTFEELKNTPGQFQRLYKAGLMD